MEITEESNGAVKFNDTLAFTNILKNQTKVSELGRQTTMG
jgi:hypothetical protein